MVYDASAKNKGPSLNGSLYKGPCLTPLLNDVSWKYNTNKNINSGFSIVTMRRVAIIFFELEVVKKFMQRF